MAAEFDANDEKGRRQFSLYSIDDVEDEARTVLKGTTVLGHTVSRLEGCFC